MVRTALLSTCFAALAAAGPISLIERAVTCATGFYIIVARGSNQAAGEGTAGQVADLIEAQVSGSISVAVDYPAAIISNESIYPASVSDGINDTITKIEDYVAACGSNSKIVLVGYSQGGNVMTDVLAGGIAKPKPLDSKYKSNIKAVVVFGDPTFTKGQSFDVGTSTKSGIFARLEGGDSLELLNTYASALQSYCDEGDPFCASGTNSTVHSEEVSKYAQAAADFAASKA